MFDGMLKVIFLLPELLQVFCSLWFGAHPHQARLQLRRGNEESVCAERVEGSLNQKIRRKRLRLPVENAIGVCSRPSVDPGSCVRSERNIS